MMDQESKKVFDALVVKDPAELTEDDQAFLRARRLYLNADQLVKFEAILDKDSGDGLDAMSPKELKKLAEEKGIETKGLKKPELIAAIRAEAEGDGE